MFTNVCLPVITTPVLTKNSHLSITKTPKLTTRKQCVFTHLAYRVDDNARNGGAPEVLRVFILGEGGGGVGEPCNGGAGGGPRHGVGGFEVAVGVRGCGDAELEPRPPPSAGTGAHGVVNPGSAGTHVYVKFQRYFLFIFIGTRI